MPVDAESRAGRECAQLPRGLAAESTDRFGARREVRPRRALDAQAEVRDRPAGHSRRDRISRLASRVRQRREVASNLERNVVLLRTRGADGTLQDGYWEALATLPAEGFINNAYTAATLQDSMPDQNPYTTYLVSALTSDPFVTLPVESRQRLLGRQPAAGDAVTAGRDLRDGRHATPLAEERGGRLRDLSDLPRLHRVVRARSDHLVSTQPDTGYSDGGPGGLVYKMIAVDVHGGVSAVATVSLASLLDVGSTGPRSLELSPLRPNPSRIVDIDVEFTLPRTRHRRSWSWSTCRVVSERRSRSGGRAPAGTRCDSRARERCVPGSGSCDCDRGAGRESRS